MVSDLVELIEKLAELYNLPKWLVNGITIYILFLFIVYFVLKIIVKKIILLRNQELLNRDLAPYFTTSDIERATRYYIPTKYQNVSPSEDDEPGRKYIASAKNSLIPLFLNKVFEFARTDNKFYLLLADSGMGKTTFMINLFINYKKANSYFYSIPKYKIRLFPLGLPKVLDEIKKIEEQENTILLLDAFDEDTNAEGRHKERMNEILEATNRFRAIVITCRTQFFPSRHEEPHETGFFSYGEYGEHKFQKLYISTFDEKDINRYLRLRFPGLHFYQRKRGRKIVGKIPNLVVRPMLLSHIEDLVNNNKIISYSFEVYQQLIDKWIERESKKPAIIKKYTSSEEYGALLLEFSKKLALHLYQNRKAKGGFYVTTEDNFGEKLNSIFSDIETAMLSETERRSRSLLNRDSEGKYKFSHKSIMEYFLALELFNNSNFVENFEFDGMDAANLFLKEFLMKYLKEEQLEQNNYIISNRKKSIGQLEFNDLDLVSEIRIVLKGNFNVHTLKVLPHLKSILFDCSELEGFYRLLSIVSKLLELITREIAVFHKNSFTSKKKIKKDLSLLNNSLVVNELLRIINRLNSLNFHSVLTALDLSTFDWQVNFNNELYHLRHFLETSDENLFMPNTIVKIKQYFSLDTQLVSQTPKRITGTRYLNRYNIKANLLNEFSDVHFQIPYLKNIDKILYECLELRAKYQITFN
ncbi:MAG: hypothetical protein WCZ90_09375 [Melioribacteraceae bacterium]